VERKRPQNRADEGKKGTSWEGNIDFLSREPSSVPLPGLHDVASELTGATPFGRHVSIPGDFVGAAFSRRATVAARLAKLRKTVIPLVLTLSCPISVYPG
jgi:hypothetical protein